LRCRFGFIGGHGRYYLALFCSMRP
jgi:hypothetical protein